MTYLEAVNIVDLLLDTILLERVGNGDTLGLVRRDNSVLGLLLPVRRSSFLGRLVIILRFRFLVICVDELPEYFNLPIVLKK